MEELPFEKCDLTHAADPGGLNVLAIRPHQPFRPLRLGRRPQRKSGAIVLLYRSHGIRMDSIAAPSHQRLWLSEDHRWLNSRILPAHERSRFISTTEYFNGQVSRSRDPVSDARNRSCHKCGLAMGTSQRRIHFFIRSVAWRRNRGASLNTMLPRCRYCGSRGPPKALSLQGQCT